MKNFEKIRDLRAELEQCRSRGETIGFVPTMGSLHEGHLSLVRAARNECDKVVTSIFVNPLQFNDARDFEKYPVDLERDFALLEKENVDFCFVPGVGEMYPERNIWPGVQGIARKDAVARPSEARAAPFSASLVRLSADALPARPPKAFLSNTLHSRLMNCLCGSSRPGHFEGMVTVVSRLFRIVEPDKVYFGQKDYQQGLIVSRLIKEMGLDIEMRFLPTVRESSGLALSSRNARLKLKDRARAANIRKILDLVLAKVLSGEYSAATLKRCMRKEFARIKEFELDYADIRDARDLSEISKIDRDAVVAVAVKIGGVRLIDNLIIKV